MATFDQNVQLYERELPRLLENDEGKFLLIHQAAAVDLFDSADAALTAGCVRFGAGEFLIKEILRRDLDIIQSTSVNGARMLESTNALIGALIAVMREIRRMEAALSDETRAESDEADLEALGEQLHEAYADLAEVYEARQAQHPSLLSLEALQARVNAEAASPGQ